jgi:hypothetical protein
MATPEVQTALGSEVEIDMDISDDDLKKEDDAVAPEAGMAADDTTAAVPVSTDSILFLY